MELNRKILCSLLIIFISVFTSVYATEYDIDIDEAIENEMASSTVITSSSGEYEYVISNSKAYITAYLGEDTTVYVPETLDGYTVVGLYTQCFAYSTVVTKVYIPYTVTAVYDDAFVSCYNLECIEVDSANTVYASDDGILYSKDYAYLVACPEAKTGDVEVNSSNIYICDYSFSAARNITSISIPASVEDIGQGAFYGTSSLEEIKVDSSNSYYLVSGGLLYNKTKTTLIKCPDAREDAITILSSVTRIEAYAFFDCSSLTGTITLPSNLLTIGEYAFFCCSQITGTITIPNRTTTIGEAAFYGMTSITSISIGSGITEIPDSCFSHCSSLTEITIPNTVYTIGDSAFYSCKGVTSLDLGEGVITIGNQAFYYLSSLTGDLVIPDSVTTIGDTAFYNCKSIDGYIIIGKGVTSIGHNIVYNSSNAKAIIFRGDLPELTSYSFTKPTNVTYYYLEGKEGFTENSNFKNKDLRVYVDNPIITFMVNDEVYTTCTLESYATTVEKFDEPELDDYNFLGWYYDTDYTQEYSFDDIFWYHTTIYAQLEEKNIIQFTSSDILIEVGETQTINYNYVLSGEATIADIVWTSSDCDVATVDENGNITGISKGEATITASYANASCSITVTVWQDENSLSITKDDITIEIGDELALEYEYHFIDEGTEADILWESSNDEVLTVENGVITAISDGSAIVTASYDDVYDEIIVTVLKNNVLTISVSQVTLEETHTYDLTYGYYFNDGATSSSIEWTSSDESIATVSNGRITAISEGTAIITATYKNVSASVEIIVTLQNYLLFEKIGYILNVNEELEIFYTCYLNNSDYENIVLTSSDEEIVTIDEENNLTAKAEGEAIITAYYGDTVLAKLLIVVSDNEYNLGDINQDGKINAEDAAIALDIYKNNTQNYTNLQLILADVNEDLKINAEDAAMILDIYKTGG